VHSEALGFMGVVHAVQAAPPIGSV